jgi:hypothetical protein
MLTRTALIVALCLGGCSSLLPTGSTETSTAFTSFDQARLALEQIQPYRTMAGELERLGFNTANIRNVTLIPYPDLIARLAPNASVAIADLDKGIQDCILARGRCTLYEFRFAQEARERTGIFLVDFFNFRRTTVTTGWRFTALVAVSDGVVLFRNYGGEPNISVVNQQNNPLGPLQGIGDAAIGRIID